MNRIQANMQAMKLTADSIRAHNLLSIFERFGDKIKVLSLDCFDTLIWRRTSTPKEVFSDLPKKTTFRSMGFTPAFRIHAEEKARQLAVLHQGTSEVTLKEIYKHGLMPLADEQIERLIEEEMELELDACYAFPPMIELIREANRRGIKIIIVSDIYFDENQLKQILAKALPDDVLPMIDKLFCSSQYRKAKTSGIFADVLNYLKCPSQSVLHLGDNFAADYYFPKLANMNAVHFVQHDECIEDLLRLQDTAAKMLISASSDSASLSSPFRGILAMNSFSNAKSETLIGYSSLGQIIYAFAKFICDEAQQLKEEGKQPKLLFLMRDAYLPSLACETLRGEAIGKRVRISRFASYAASFSSLDAIDSYLIEMGGTNRFHDIARQLLLPDKVSTPLIQTAMQSENPEFEFLKLLRRKDIVRIIVNKSAEYKERLLTHLKKEIGLEKGDTLVFVDLGYSGTAQRRLTPVFNDIGVHVTGRYLLSLRVPGWENNRCGLIDPSWCEDSAMHAIVIYITLLEQLCTSNERSVIDYDKMGNAIYSSVMMNNEQQEKLNEIQSECVRFVREAHAFFTSLKTMVSMKDLRQAALTELGRMIFLPTEGELNYLKIFQAEMNLGTNDILRVFDPELGLTGLRRRGMFYMEKPSKTTRTNYPAELRTAGIELVLTLMAQHRFRLDLKLKDMVIRKETIPILFRQGNEVYKTKTEAVATHDGFFAMWLPTNMQISVIFGESHDWVQIESAEFIPMDAFANQTETQNTMNAWPYLVFEDVEDHGAHLYKLNGLNSALLIQPIQKGDFVLRLVFRPIVKRDKPAAKAEGLLNTG